MRFRIYCTWNNIPVLEGRCSGVMAHSVITHLAGDFSNAEKAGFKIPSIENINGMVSRQEVSCTGRDETGTASYFLIAI